MILIDRLSMYYNLYYTASINQMVLYLYIFTYIVCIQRFFSHSINDFTEKFRQKNQVKISNIFYDIKIILFPAKMDHNCTK